MMFDDSVVFDEGAIWGKGGWALKLQRSWSARRLASISRFNDLRSILPSNWLLNVLISSLKKGKLAGPRINCGGSLERRVIIAAVLLAVCRDNVVLYLALAHPSFIN